MGHILYMVDSNLLLRINLKFLREKKGLTQAELGAKMKPHKTQNYISKLESGEKGFSTKTLNEAIAALECEPWELLVSRTLGGLSDPSQAELQAKQLAKDRTSPEVVDPAILNAVRIAVREAGLSDEERKIISDLKKLREHRKIHYALVLAAISFDQEDINYYLELAHSSADERQRSEVRRLLQALGSLLLQATSTDR